MADYVTISQLTRYLKKKFDSDEKLRNITLRGEISNFTHHSRGHFYFTLKDEFSQISAIMFASNASKIDFKPKEGIEVIVNGNVSVYEQTGKYQVYANRMIEYGKGTIQLEFEKLKKKLEKEGKLDDKYKQDIPRIPNTIGVITSPTGAAVRDIYDTINRRFPLVKIEFYPTLVQGDSAKQSIVENIHLANARGNCDVLILGRGGGSIEDLWAFNEEIVANAIFDSKIPIISAVGHETDFTIADFVADLRVPTPTAAGEVVVPDRRNILKEISISNARMLKSIENRLLLSENRLKGLRESQVFINPIKMLTNKELQLDSLLDRVKAYSPKRLIEKYISRLNDSNIRINNAYNNKLTINTNRFTSLLDKLDLLNPLSIIKKGYSVVLKDNVLVSSIDKVSIKDNLEIKLQDGYLDVEVKDKKGDRDE